MPFRRWPSKTSSRRTGSDPLFAQPTPEHYLVAHIDGGARGNPGPAGYGVVIEDEQARPVAELFEYLGLQTNNYAEYNGLLAALKFAVEHNVPAIRILSDSELLVKQIRGEYKVSSPTLKELYDRARVMIRELEWFTIEHVRRERNREADALANKAMDRRQPGLVLRQLPEPQASASAAPSPAASVRPDTNNSSAQPEIAYQTECEGVVRGGRVEVNAKLPEGARVRVRVID